MKAHAVFFADPHRFATGPGAVMQLDGRSKVVNWHRQAKEACLERKFEGYRLVTGPLANPNWQSDFVRVGQNDQPAFSRVGETVVFHRPVSARELLQAAEEVTKEAMYRAAVLDKPEVVYEYLKVRLALEPVELFVAIWLDSQMGVLEAEVLARGTISATAVYPREVVVAALKAGAASVIFAHNHPSGSLKPSSEDRMLTERLKTALSAVDIRVLDHIVVGGAGYASMAMLGIL